MSSVLDLIPRRVYKIQSRNLTYAIWNGKDGFIGIRYKCGDRFLDTEFHWALGGTAIEQYASDYMLPENIPLSTYLDCVDEKTNRPVYFDKPISDGGKGWIYKDTDKPDQSIRPVSVQNKAMFDFLSAIEKEFKAQE